MPARKRKRIRYAKYIEMNQVIYRPDGKWISETDMDMFIDVFIGIIELSGWACGGGFRLAHNPGAPEKKLKRT